MLKFLDLMCSAAQLYMTPLTVAHQTPLSKELSRQEYWSKLPFPTPGHLPDPGIKPMTPASPAFAGGFFTTEPSGKPDLRKMKMKITMRYHFILIRMTVERKKEREREEENKRKEKRKGKKRCISKGIERSWNPCASLVGM